MPVYARIALTFLLLGFTIFMFTYPSDFKDPNCWQRRYLIKVAQLLCASSGFIFIWLS
jgi:hypothetical protein